MFLGDGLVTAGAICGVVFAVIAVSEAVLCLLCGLAAGADRPVVGVVVCGLVAVGSMGHDIADPAIQFGHNGAIFQSQSETVRIQLDFTCRQHETLFNYDFLRSRQLCFAQVDGGAVAGIGQLLEPDAAGD